MTYLFQPEDIMIPQRFLPHLLVLLATLATAGCAKPDPPTMNLYRAIRAGDINQISRNLYWGSDINAPDADGQYPLHVAASKGDVAIVRMLLDHGAQIDAANREGRSALYLALAAGKTQVARLLLKRGATFAPDALLFEMVRKGQDDRDVLNFLLRHGAGIDSRDHDGNAPLHIAVAHGHRRVARMLIDHGANVNAVNNTGETPLAIALRLENPDLIRLLKRNGATTTPLP